MKTLREFSFLLYTYTGKVFNWVRMFSVKYLLSHSKLEHHHNSYLVCIHYEFAYFKVRYDLLWFTGTLNPHHNFKFELGIACYAYSFSIIHTLLDKL
jgi:hypothetical protein